MTPRFLIGSLMDNLLRMAWARGILGGRSLGPSLWKFPSNSWNRWGWLSSKLSGTDLKVCDRQCVTWCRNQGDPGEVAAGGDSHTEGSLGNDWKSFSICEEFEEALRCWQAEEQGWRACSEAGSEHWQPTGSAFPARVFPVSSANWSLRSEWKSSS